MKIGIDASNIVSGGGLNHIVELLSNYELQNNKIKEIIIWSSNNLLEKIPNNTTIIKKTNIFLNSSKLLRFFWQIFILPKQLKYNQCDVIFLPGGTFVPTVIPKISMCQNLLPFSWFEIKRFGISFFAFKLVIIRFMQSISFLNADGVIFLSDYSKNRILKEINIKDKKIKIIPHGVNSIFFKNLKKQKSIDQFSFSKPFKFLYVSHLWPYKNHLTILKSIAILRNKGFPITIDLVGGSYSNTLKAIKNESKKLDPNNEFIFYNGLSTTKNLVSFYHKSDGFIFGSSCETFGQIITEAMMSGLPIICSEKSSMQEVLKESSLYYNPFDTNDLVKTIKLYLSSKEIRQNLSIKGHKEIQHFMWSKCSKNTFTFFLEFKK